MHSINLSWKEFNVNLLEVSTHIKATYPACLGSSADYYLTLWFSEEPSEADKTAIQAYWDSIDEESSEATSYLPATAITDAISSLKTGMLSKEWADMSVAERKILLGQTPTREDLGL